MLKSLHVKDFAIIDNIDLEFHQGMTVLTGETGAGKSIIVDAISLLLGDRAAKEMISSHSDSAKIIGEFDIKSKDIKNILDQQGIDYDQLLVIERIISKDNRNLVKINNQTSSLKTLKDLAIFLADIHSQFDTNQLINPDNYLGLIDNFRRDKIKQFLDSYTEALENYRHVVKDYYKLIAKKEETLKQLDLYKFQYSELKNMKLIENEYQELEENINVLDNIDKINTLLQKSHNTLTEEMLLDRLYEIKADFQSISSTSKEFENIHDRLQDIYYELDDINSTIIDKLDTLNYDKDDFEMMNQRLNDLEKIQKKYHKDIKELIDYQNFLEEEINQVENYDDIIQEKAKSVKEFFDKLLIEANNLSLFREDIAKKITKDVIETLHELVIKHAEFKVEFTKIVPKDEFDYQAFKTDGLDAIEFMISTNKGEPLKPLAKTASGGEMSRIMLAFKTIFARSQNIPTIIFDEIDTGISGFIAKQIARKIAELAKITQVISITHIPQVVAQGNHHLSVTKEIVKNQTKIFVKYLNYEERIDEIAKMVSADKVTNAGREIARELLINPENN